MRIYRARQAQSGFTLIELLVVIAIIAILAAILFPVFAQARASARKISGLSNVKQVTTGILMYNQDYDEKFPRSGWSCASDWPNNSCGITQWPNVVAPYHKSAQLVVDSGDASSYGGITYSNGKHSLLYNDLLSHHPGINADGTADWDVGGPNNAEHEQTPLGNAEVNAPADCVMVTEGYCPWGADSGDNLKQTETATDWTGDNHVHSKWKWEQSMSQYQAILITGTNYGGWNAFQGLPMHQQGTNYSYTDGHAKWVKAYDPGQASNTKTYGNLLHGTLPFRQKYDPGQHRMDLPNDLHLGGNGGSDNWH